MSQTKLWILLAGIVAVGTAACKDTRETGAVTTRTSEGVSSTPDAETAARRDMAMVRVVNAISSNAPVTIWAGDSVGFADVSYKTTSEWQQIPSERFNFQIKSTTDGRSLAQNMENLRGGGHYTIVALPSRDKADERTLRVLHDDLQPVPIDKARVRFINGVASDEDVDLIVSGREDAIFDGVDFADEAGWKEVDPVTGTLTVRPDNGATVLATMSNAKLEGGRSYTFVLVGRTLRGAELVQIVDDVASGMGADWDAARETRQRVEP